MALAFRPHHFLCALCFQGKGYSPAFIHNFKDIMETLNAVSGDAVPIQVVCETDSICAPCPNRMQKTCVTEKKIIALDLAHANALKIVAHETITWGQAKQRIKTNINLENFQTICASCNWKSLGLCENSLRAFLDA
jgi:hypothetical protein